jgi:hypothetical protein
MAREPQHIHIELGRGGYDTTVFLNDKKVLNLAGIRFAITADDATEVHLVMAPDRMTMTGPSLVSLTYIDPITGEEFTRESQAKESE